MSAGLVGGRRTLAVFILAGGSFYGCSGAPSTVLPPPPAPIEVSEAASEEAISPDTLSDEGRRSLTPRERSLVRRLLGETERVRGLRLTEEVNVEVHTASRIGGHLVEDLDAEELADAKTAYVALGLLSPDLELLPLMHRVLSEQVVGYYDPDSHRLVLRDDVMRELATQATVIGASRMNESLLVIVHEMVHALQDQQHRLGETFDVERDSDATHAYRAIVEGDATLGMIAWMLEGSGQSLSAFVSRRDLLGQLGSAMASGGNSELAAAPAILRETLIGAYLHGLLFTAALYRDGGWDAVDGAHRDLPTTAEQVLHPEKYRQREGALEISLPDFPGLRASGYEVPLEDTLGELEMACYFGQRDDSIERNAAAGWAGDRLGVYRHASGEAAVVWFTAWDDAREAIEAERAARNVIADQDGTRYLVQRRDRAVLIVRNLPPANQTEVRAAFRAWATSF